METALVIDNFIIRTNGQHLHDMGALHEVASDFFTSDVTPPRRCNAWWWEGTVEWPHDELSDPKFIGDTRPATVDELASVVSGTSIEPLPLDYDGHAHGRGSDDSFGRRWYSEPIDFAYDPDMPAEDRERIALELKIAGARAEMQSKGIGHCMTCHVGMFCCHRVLPGDKLAGTVDLLWDEALAHHVREHGLRIDPAILLDRFGVLPSGERPVMLGSSHAG